MALTKAQLPKIFSKLSFEEAFKIAKDKGGELCVVVRQEKENETENKVRAQFWILNGGGTSRSFYNKHRKKKNSLFCIVPHWFIEIFLGIHLK